MAISSEPYSATVHFVSKRVYPWETWTLEYFTTHELADRVARFYREHSREVDGGIDITVGYSRAQVLKSEAGLRLYDAGINGALHMVEAKFDLTEKAKDVKILKEWVQAQLKK